MKRYVSILEKWKTKYEKDQNGDSKPIRVDDEKKEDEKEECADKDKK